MRCRIENPPISFAVAAIFAALPVPTTGETAAQNLVAAAKVLAADSLPLPVSS